MQSSNTQISLGASLSDRKTRKAIFLEQMDHVVSWSRLLDLIAPSYPACRTRRPTFELGTMLRTHFMQQWFNLSDPAVEEAFFNTPLSREFVGLHDNVRLPNESTILRFRHRLEKHGLAPQMLAEANSVLIERGLMPNEGSAGDATLIAAPGSTKNKDKARGLKMHSGQEGNQWYFGMKANIGVDVDSGFVRTVRCTSDNKHDITQAHRLLHGHETFVWADAGYKGVEKRPGADPSITWHVAMRPGRRKALNQAGEMGQLLDKAEKFKADIRGKLEHPFRVIKRQFGYMKPRYRGLQKNGPQIATLSALSNLWTARHDLIGARA